MDFPNLFHAEVEGYASARDLAAAALYKGAPAADAVEVADEDGNIVSRIKVEPKYLVA